MMIHRRTLSAVLPAVCTDNPNAVHKNVQIDPSGACRATDGHIALIATDRHGFRYPDEDFPLIPGAPFHGDPKAPIQVDPGTVKRLIGAMPKQGKRTPIAILNAIQVSRTVDDSAATLAATDLTAPIVATIHPEDRSFPTIERVIPAANKADTVTVVFAAGLLEKLIAAAKAVQSSKPMQAIRFDIPTGAQDRFKNPDDTPGEVCGPIRVSITGEDTEVIGAIMPCRP